MRGKTPEIRPNQHRITGSKAKFTLQSRGRNQYKVADLENSGRTGHPNIQSLPMVKSLRQQYDALQREIVARSQSLDSLTRQANESSRLLQKLAATGENLKSMGDSIESVGNKIAPVSAAVTALGFGAVATAANFESSMHPRVASLLLRKIHLLTSSGNFGDYFR